MSTPTQETPEQIAQRIWKAERELAEAEKVLQGIIDGCVHPDRALRAVLVTLAPIREWLERRRAAQ